MTNIPFKVGKQGHVTLQIRNLQGAVVSTLIDQSLQAGEYRAEWYVSKVPSGTYLCVLTTEESICLKKVLVVK